MPKPRVILVDVRNGPVKKDGFNIDLPLEGQVSALVSIETADVLVEIHADGMFVKTGSEKGWVTMFVTKSVHQLNAEKAARELQARVGDKQADDLAKGDHPSVKMNRVWDKSDPDYVESGGHAKGTLRGY